MKELLCLLEERLIQHDNNRKEVQEQLREACAKIEKEADSLEERISRELNNHLSETEERILGLIEQLNNSDNENIDEFLINQVQCELLSEVSYEIQHKENVRNFADSYELKTSETKSNFIIKEENNTENIINKLREHLNKVYESITAAQDNLTEVCTKRKNEAVELEIRANEELETHFSREDARIQETVNLIKRENEDINNDSEEELKTKTKLTLLKNQKYSLNNTKCELIIRKEVSLKWINFKERKPTNIISFTDKGELSLSFTFFSDDEIDVLKDLNLSFTAIVKIWDKSKSSENNAKLTTKEYILGEKQHFYFDELLIPSTTYCLKMKIKCFGLYTQWSDDIKFKTPEFKDLCVWKECPEYVINYRNYFVDENNPRIVTKIDCYNRFCTIIGNTPLPLNTITSWNIKILNSLKNNGGGILVGVAPFDIDQYDKDNSSKCGWYFNCYWSALYSGPPHKYNYKKYGLRKKDGEYVHTGDSVGVVMDTTKGELSIILNGVNFGVAFEGIPLDKPLVPCVLLWFEGDSIELDTSSEVKETKLDISIPIPSNIVSRNDTWDSITFTWDAVEGASFYQVEVDGSKSWDISATNSFKKLRLLPETEHSFRIRAVKDNKVSKWSEVAKRKTFKVPEFSGCAWKECPEYVINYRKHFVDENNPRIATKNGWARYYSTIIGNTPLPSNKVTSWNIKILNSKNNDGKDIFIGVAPFDIDQNERYNYYNCGWYFNCYYSSLRSGPPHNYEWKEYGPRKDIGGYVHKGDSVGVVVDITKGELSFIVNGMNYGVAYEGIPLDKPLVPCVILYCDYDSVELDLSEVKENMDSSVFVPSNIVAKSNTWDSITLTWDAVEGASFYQIEVDGSKFLYASTTNTFTKRGLLSDTEYNFKVRTVRGNIVSEWSDSAKERTQKELFEYSFFKKGKYIIDENNYRIATNNVDFSNCYFYRCCTIIGSTPLPPNKVTSWNIKILKSLWNNRNDIYIGIAPFDIDQGDDENHEKCGWYYHCFNSSLYSGPPHNYFGKEIGPRKKRGEYVLTGDSVGVAMDMVKCELSFILNGVNLGVAFKGIPLDKPLVPCVLLYYPGDSVELLF